MRLRQIFEAEGKTAAMAFGRMNPPTIGHEKLVNVIAGQKADPFLFVTQTQKPKTDPLPFNIKLQFAQTAFPNVTVGDENVKTIIQALQKIESLGYKNLIYVAGSDRVDSFTELLNNYNGKDYNFNSIKVVSAGERDPDAEGAEGMSASKMREAAMKGNFEAFAQGLPRGLQNNAKNVYSAVRTGMGIKELEPAEDYDVEEGWKSNLAGAALAATAALGPNAQAQTSGEDFLPDIVAHVKFKVNDKEITKDINLGTTYKSPKEAGEALEEFLKSKGIKNFTFSLERVKSKDTAEGRYDRRDAYQRDYDNSVAGMSGRRREVDDEANIMYRYNHETGKLVQKMIDVRDERSAKAEGWRYEWKDALRTANIIQSKFDPKKFVQKQGNKWVPVNPFKDKTEGVAEVYPGHIQKGKELDAATKEIQKKLDKRIKKVDNKDKKGVAEGYGRYWCSTDKKWKERKGPKQKRSS